jgi:kindlin 2
LCRPKRFTLRAFKRYWFTCSDLRLELYRSREDAHAGAQYAHLVNLRGCEVTPDVNISQGKYGIRLEVPSADGMSEMWIRCENVRSCYYLYFRQIKFSLYSLFKNN